MSNAKRIRIFTDVKRRHAILVFAVVSLGIASSSVSGQIGRRNRPARIATLDDAVETTRGNLWTNFRRRLTELGYADRDDVVFEQRWAGGKVEKLADLAAELVALDPDVIVAVTTTAALAAKNATARIPIVAIGPADPVKSGLVASLGRPGGNVTGFSPNQAEIAGKWLEIVRAIVPRAKSLAYLTDRGNPGEMLVFLELQERARGLGLDVKAMDGLTKSSVEETFESIQRERVDALIVATTAALLEHRQQIVRSAARLRLPTVYPRREYPEQGGLLSYGTDTGALFLRAADYVDQILKGAQPSELPFELASTFTMVVNARTARELGLTIPQSVLIRADEVIR